MPLCGQYNHGKQPMTSGVSLCRNKKPVGASTAMVSYSNCEKSRLHQDYTVYFWKSFKEQQLQTVLCYILCMDSW